MSTLAPSAGAPAAAQLGECAPADGAPGVSVVITGPDAGVAEPDRLVRAYLLAGHHGGTLRSTWGPDGPCFGLRLLAEPGAGDRPEPDADWLTEQFARLEDWGG